MKCFLSAVAVLAFASLSAAQVTPPPQSVNDKLDAILAKLTACEAKFTVIDRRLDALEAARSPQSFAQAPGQPGAFYSYQQPYAAGACGQQAAYYSACAPAASYSAGACGQSFGYAAGACGSAGASADAGACGSASGSGSGRRGWLGMGLIGPGTGRGLFGQ